jgi:hypothetical protein
MFYHSETWSQTLSKDHKLKIIETKILYIQQLILAIAPGNSSPLIPKPATGDDPE